MNLLCPNCSKPITIPDQYAGQLMKCPLCANNFTAPGMPDTGSAAAPATPSWAPAEPAPAPAGEVYGLRPDPPAAPTQTPAAAPATPFPNVVPSPVTEKAPAPPPPLSTGSTTAPKGFTIWLSPRILQWLAPAAVFLAFLFTFFPWVGFYPGGVPVDTQTAWGAAFGMKPTTDPDLQAFSKLLTDKQLDANKDLKDNRPGVSLLTLFYILVLLPTVVIALGAAVLPFFKDVKLPPAVGKMFPYRWGIVAALNLLLLLLLCLQLMLNFSIESNLKNWYDDKAKKELAASKKEALDTKETKQAQIDRGFFLHSLHRTIWLKLTVVLHFLALASAGLVYWVGNKGKGYPTPKIEIVC
jgi:hypothetical protein